MDIMVTSVVIAAKSGETKQTMTNNTDTAREFLRNYMKWEDSQGNKLMEVRFVENALVSYASRFTPAPIKSGHDFLERKLKEGWRLEASDMTNCLAALLDEYGQRTPAQIESGLDFLKRKLKEGWGLEASDMTNCLAALLDEYGQRNPAPIGDEEINDKILRLVPVGNKTVEDSMIPCWIVRRKMRELIKWYQSAPAKKEGERACIT